MAKVSQDQRNLYQNNINHYKNNIEEIKKEINNLKFEISRNKLKENYIRFKIANLILGEITNYCSLNEISVFLLEVKNTAFIEKARQLLYETIINIEKIVTNYIDVSFSEYADNLEKINEINDLEKLNFIKKLGYCIDLVKENLGENTKWKWSFVEIDSRFSVITKNIFDLKKFQSLDDPNQKFYKERKEHFSLIQKLLNNSSQGYRDKFEFSTKDIEDLKKAIDLQKAVLRLNQLSLDDVKIEKSKKQIEVWSNILEKHLAQIEEEKKKKQIIK